MASLLETINRVPPKTCRLLARVGPNNRQRPMTNDEIIARAVAAGFTMSRGTAAKLSQLDRWDRVTATKMQAWISGTGIDPLNCRRHKKFMVRPDVRLKYMENGTSAQRRMIDRILPKYKASRPNGQACPPNGQIPSQPK